MSDAELAQLRERLRRMEARRDRERTARHDAERLLEEKSLELWTANKRLEGARQFLEEEVTRRTEALVKANEDLERAMQEAQQASRAREAFMATMSHEIRTPMNGVLGLARLLRRTSLDADQSALVLPMVESAESLMRILDDVLDWSSIAAGGITLRSEPFQPDAMVRELVELYQGTVRNDGTRLHVEVDRDLPEWVHGDGGRVRQVLRNLVGNAVKFASGGVVRIIARRRGDIIRLEVHDNGPGMTKEQAERVFRAFTQADENVHSQFGGTGLGLSISDALVRRMGGTLRCESVLGAGSRFIVELPLKEAKVATPELVHEDDTAHDLRILVVDDHAVNRLVARRYLESMGAQVWMAGGGIEALDILVDTPVDLIMTDIHMPEMNGIELTQRIRAGEGGRAHTDVPVVGLSADVMPERRAACVNAGMVAFLAKPFTQQELSEVLSEWSPEPQMALRSV